MFKFRSLNYETHTEFFVNCPHKIKLALLYNVTGILPLLSRTQHCFLIFNSLNIWFRESCFWVRRDGRYFSQNIVILCESSFNFRLYSTISNLSIRITVIHEIYITFIVILLCHCKVLRSEIDDLWRIFFRIWRGYWLSSVLLEIDGNFGSFTRCLMVAFLFGTRKLCRTFFTYMFIVPRSSSFWFRCCLHIWAIVVK